MSSANERTSEEKQRKPSDRDPPDVGKAPSRPVGAPKRIPGQDIDKKRSDHKDGDVDEDGRGRLERDND